MFWVSGILREILVSVPGFVAHVVEGCCDFSTLCGCHGLRVEEGLCYGYSFAIGLFCHCGDGRCGEVSRYLDDTWCHQVGAVADVRYGTGVDGDCWYCL